MASKPPPYSEFDGLSYPLLKDAQGLENYVVKDLAGSGPIIQQQPNAYKPSAQPHAEGWIKMPQPMPQNYSGGLQYLSTFDQLHVRQEVKLLKENDCCTRNCFGQARPFEMRIIDNFNEEIIHLSRPYACQSCCFPCCLQRIDVFSPPGCFVGSVEQNWSILYPKFSILNDVEEKMLNINGPHCTCSMCGDVNFEVSSKDGTTVVGGIAKQWSGLGREMFTDADFFSITFPMDLDVRTKAVMLGACFLIDMMYFEN